MKNDVLTNSSKNYLSWIRNRLKFKYKESDDNLASLNDIIKNKKIIDSSIDSKKVDAICNKLWPNFDGSNSGSLVAINEYSEQEKQDIRKLVTNILIEARKINI